MDLLTVTCLISAIISLVFALTIFTLRRSARMLHEKRWAIPFETTFFVLAGMYALKFGGLIARGNLDREFLVPLTWTVSITTLLASGVTNYLFLLSAFHLAEPALRQRLAIRLRKILVEKGHLTLLVLCAAGLIQIVSDVWSLSGWLRVVALLPDNAFSALALLSMGSVLSRNIRFRSDTLMARVVLWSSVAYALLYGFYFLNDIGREISDAGAGKADLLTFTAALVLKVGLFFPAFSLLLLMSAPLTGIERLLKTVTRHDKEFLENDGIVKSICEELHLDRVDLYVRLPGEKENKIALLSHSKPADNKDPQVFKYEEGTDYAKVMTTGEPDVVNGADYSYTLLRRISRFTVPIFFHGAVIACLKAHTREERFTAVDLGNLKRIASIVSPAVQNYREMFALNKLSHDLSALQIEVMEYKLDEDIKRMCELIHNVTSSAIVGLSIEAGFFDYHAVYPPRHPLEDEVNGLFHAEIESNDFKNEDRSRRWLITQLKMNPPAGRSDEVFGRFIMGIDGKKPAKNPPIGTSPVCLRALTDLVTDTLLDFIRGSLNQLKDELGEKLSGSRLISLEDWHDPVTKIAGRVTLPWVVISKSDRGNDRLGDAAALQLINRIERPEHSEKWDPKAAGFSFYRPKLHEAGVSCVVRKKLPQSQHTIWFGVAHPKFGPELEFISPWTYFLDHFCAIADSSLRRLLERKRHVKTISNIDPFTDLHELASLASPIRNFYMKLKSSVELGTIQCSEDDKKVIKTSQDLFDRFNQVLKLSSGATKHDERVGISIGDVLKTVLKGLNGQFEEHKISLEICELQTASSQALLDVPFYVVENALFVILDNARAVLSSSSRSGQERKIKILIDNSTDENLTCSVIDNGPGVRRDIAKKLFVDPCRDPRKPHSNGFGLFLAVSLLWSFYGNIKYERQKIDEENYTVFQITLPRYQPRSHFSQNGRQNQTAGINAG